MGDAVSEPHIALRQAQKTLSGGTGKKEIVGNFIITHPDLLNPSLTNDVNLSPSAHANRGGATDFNKKFKFLVLFLILIKNRL